MQLFNKPIVASIVTLIAVLALSACGGGGSSGGVNSTPPPGPATAPTPATPLPLAATAFYPTIKGTLSYTGTLWRGQFDGGGTAVLNEAGASGRGPAITFAYDAERGTYSLTNGTDAASFAAADQAAATGYELNFAKDSGTISDKLTLFGNASASVPAASAPISLSYMSYGFWSHADSASQKTRNAYFIYGQPTGAISTMPVTGTATYQASVNAYMLQYAYVPSQITNLTGSASFTADFGAGTVSTALNLSAFSHPFNGTGTISGDQFSGTFSSASTIFNAGAFMGGFYGPAAQEMGYAFYIQNYNADPYSGASIAPMFTTVSGVVVGTRR